MNEFDLSEIDTVYTEARHNLSEALKADDMLDYAAFDGLLELGDLKSVQVADESFQEVVRLYGWPSGYEDGLLEPTVNYASAKDFIDSLRREDEFGLSHLVSSHFLR